MDKKELLKFIIKNNSSVILTNLLEGKDINNSYILPSLINKEELVGYYKDNKYCSPKWLTEINNDEKNIILVIDKIDSITFDEQDKFVELIKYKKVSTFKLKDECRIILTAKKIEQVSSTIKDLVIYIGGN